MTPDPSPTDTDSPSRLLFDARPGASGRLNDESSDESRLVTDTDGWRIINDTVMGGQSSSQFTEADGHATFSGTVSLDGGGFASVRSPAGPYDLGDARAFVLLVRGDGKTYNLTAYTEPGGRVSYRHRFEASSGWTRVEIPFSSLTAYRRGQTVPSAPDFAPASVREFGFLIGDRQGGPFHLDICWIGAA